MGLRLWIAALGMIGAGAAPAQDQALRQQLFPTGKLRVAIAVSPSASALYVLKDASAAAGYRGVSIDLGAAMAGRLGVAVEYVPYLASGEITQAADQNIWDVTFMPVDAERKKSVDFGKAYHLLQSTYLVAPGAAISTLAEVNREGVRIAGVANTATGRASAAASPKASVVTVAGVDEGVALMRAGRADAIALSRESLAGLLPQLPGARVLEGGFMNSTTAVAVPKGKPLALAWVSDFIEGAKASGGVRRALDAVGLTGSQVAPAGMEP